MAVNFAKMTQSQGFSFGIPSGKLKTLYNEKEYRAGLSTPAEGTGGLKAPPKEEVVPTPVMDDVPNEDAETKAYLTRFLAAENEREFNKIWSFFATPMHRYYDLTSPTYESVPKTLCPYLGNYPQQLQRAFRHYPRGAKHLRPKNQF